jgi:hypothetical protein
MCFMNLLNQSGKEEPTVENRNRRYGRNRRNRRDGARSVSTFAPATRRNPSAQAEHLSRVCGNPSAQAEQLSRVCGGTSAQAEQLSRVRGNPSAQAEQLSLTRGSTSAHEEHAPTTRRSFSAHAETFFMNFFNSIILISKS